jgi:hypothetical protein
MTLHITHVSRQYTLQVSDRLVSGGLKDPLANKNVIYFARNGVFTICYTGLAYGLDYGLSPSNINQPTDEWIAQILWGKPFFKNPKGDGPAFIQGRNPDFWLDIGQSINLLRKKLQSSIDQLNINWRKEHFELVVSGGQINRSGVKPILVKLIKPKGEKELKIESRSRTNASLIDDTPHGFINIEDSEKLCNLQTLSFEEKKKLFVQIIRGVASRNKTKVGQDCMCVILDHAKYQCGYAFIPNSIHTKNGIPVVYSPWIIMSDKVYAPSIKPAENNISAGVWVTSQVRKRFY